VLLRYGRDETVAVKPDRGDRSFDLILH